MIYFDAKQTKDIKCLERAGKDDKELYI